MDLVDWSQERFDEIRAEFTDFARKLEFTDLTFIPVSALLGDNVIRHSPNTPWYQGPTLLWYLENVYTGSDRNLIDPRFPVQYVVRPHSNDFHDYRGFAGTVAGGAFRPGDEVLVLPSGLSSTIVGVDQFGGPIDEATPNMSVTIRLADEIDISRGDMLCRPHNSPTVGQDVDAMICWFNEKPLQPRGFYSIKHTTRSARAMVKDLHYRLDVNTLHRHDPDGNLAMNEMGRVTLRTTVPLMFDEYRRNRQTGSFILVDEATHETMGAGMILGESQ
jgi:bifunctional enzyme CysN/CysC